MTRLTSALAAATILLLYTPAAAAPILNGGFESGFTNWTTTGITSIETAAFGTPPAGGVQMARMSSGDGAEVGAVSDAMLEAFLALGAGDIDAIVTTNDVLFGAREGSAIKQTFFANAGAVLSFDWNFLTNELLPVNDTNDTAFWTIIPGGANFLADTFSMFIPAATLLDAQTGFQTVNFVIPATGFYTLGFAVVDVSDVALGSVLLVDNVQVVPQPAMLTLTAIALTALGYRLRRR